jgi:hypothetical protein
MKRQGLVKHKVKQLGASLHLFSRYRLFGSSFDAVATTKAG